MEYLNYLQQYRETYHLDDIFISNNLEEQQIKIYIENLCNVSFYHLERFLEHPEKGSDYYNHRIGVYVLKNSVLKNNNKDVNVEYITRLLVTSLDIPDPLILDSISREDNSVINKLISQHENTSSDTLLYLASSSIYFWDIKSHKNINNEVLSKLTKTLLRDLDNRIFFKDEPKEEDWEFVNSLSSRRAGFNSDRAHAKMESLVEHSLFNEDMLDLILASNDEVLKTLEWYGIFYRMGRNPYISETILELLSERKPVWPRKPSCLIGVLENPNTPKHILEKHLDNYPHIKQWREINFGE